MTWLDDQGIAHDGEPPTGHCMMGGRWYPVEEPAEHADRRSELVGVA